MSSLEEFFDVVMSSTLPEDSDQRGNHKKQMQAAAEIIPLTSQPAAVQAAEVFGMPGTPISFWVPERQAVAEQPWAATTVP
jgi:hypothetical protein